MSVTGRALAFLALNRIETAKRKPGRPRSRHKYTTLLTGARAVAHSRGRPNGAAKYTRENMLWLVGRVEARKAEALAATGTVISDRAAIRQDMFEYYRNEKGDSVNAAKRHIARYMPKVQKALSRFRLSEAEKEKSE